MYSMRQQLQIGEKCERELDRHFCGQFHIKEVTRQQQRQGIDRIFTSKKSGQVYKIEYKCDERAARTGNAFVETISVDTANKPGWAYTCQADFIIYYIAGCGPAYVIKPSTIKRNLPTWSKKYREVPSQNNGYKTWGLLVPLMEFEKAAYQVISF